MSNLFFSVNNKIKDLIIKYLNINYNLNNNFYSYYEVFINNIDIGKDNNGNDKYILINFYISFYPINNHNNINFKYFIGLFYFDDNNNFIIKNIIEHNFNIIKICKTINNHYLFLDNNNNIYCFNDNNNVIEVINNININNIINISNNIINNNTYIYILYYNSNNYIIDEYIYNYNELNYNKKIKTFTEKINDIYYFNNDFVLIKDNEFIYEYNNNDIINKFYGHCIFNNNLKFNSFWSNNNNLFFSSISNINNYNMLLGNKQLINNDEQIKEIFNYDIFIKHLYIENDIIKCNNFKINYNNTKFNINVIVNNNNYEYNYSFLDNRFVNFYTFFYKNKIYIMNNNFDVININELQYKEKYELINYKIINDIDINNNNVIKFINIIDENDNYLIINPSIDIEYLSNIIMFDDKVIFSYNKNNNYIDSYTISNNQLNKDSICILNNVINNINCMSYLSNINNFNNSNKIIGISNNSQLQIFIYNNNWINSLNENLNNIISLTIAYGTYFTQNNNDDITYIINNIFILLNNNNHKIIKHYLYNYFDNNSFNYIKDININDDNILKLYYYHYEGLYINYNIYAYSNNKIYKINFENNTYENIITYENNDIIYFFIYNNDYYIINKNLNLFKYISYNNSTLIYDIDFIYYPLNNEIKRIENINEIDNIKQYINITNKIGHYIINNKLNIMIYDTYDNDTKNFKLQLIYNI